MWPRRDVTHDDEDSTEMSLLLGSAAVVLDSVATLIASCAAADDDALARVT